MHVAAEAAVAVVVLAVDVGSDGAAHGDIAGPGGDGYKPAQRHQRPHQLVESHPGIDPHTAVGVVDLVGRGEASHVEDIAPGILCGVAVAATEPARNHTTVTHLAKCDRDLVARSHPMNQRPTRCGSPPAGQKLRRHRGRVTHAQSGEHATSTMPSNMARTVIVEPHPIGHRFQHVAHLVRAARANGDDVELLTSTGARARPEFDTFLGELPLLVHERMVGFFPPAREIAEALLDLHRRSPIDTVVVLDADQALKRWWRVTPMALRGRRGPRTVLFLMRFPQNLTLSDPRLLAMKVAKVALSALARATRAADRVVYLVGRDKSGGGWLLEPVRDPAICGAHARDRLALRHRHGLPPDRRLVGIVGEISIRKCVPTVAEAVRRAGPDVDLLLAGPISDDMQEWLDTLPPVDRSRVHTRPGFLSDNEIDAYVAASDIVSLALLNPGPSGIQGKALVAGVPVLSAGSKLRERETRAYGAGLHVDLDAPSLASGIRTLLDRGKDPIPTPDNLPTAEEFAAVMLGVKRAHIRAGAVR